MLPDFRAGCSLQQQWRALTEQRYTWGMKFVNTWYSLSLGDGMMADGPSEQILQAFGPLFDAAGKPAEMAVFTRAESEGRLHCEVIAYFSPASAKIAEEFEAEPCEKPARSGLGLLAGDPRCWSLLFPESVSN
jgi:hypothetical protein